MKITLFVVIIICLSTINPSYSANSVEILKELINHMEMEVERDREIISWVDNLIAFQQTREFLKRDLAKKKRLIEILENSKNINMSNVIKWISKNIYLENKIKDSLTVDVNVMLARMSLVRDARRQIKQALPEKERLILDLKNIIVRP